MHVVSKWTGVPLQRMEQKETAKLLAMEAEIKQRVIGQDEAVGAICKALRRSRADLKDPRRPIGSFVFLGPTGVGKTFLAQHSGRIHVWRFRRAHPDRHVGVHGEIHRLAPDRLASGLRRLRRRRPAYRSGPPPALLRRALRRNRKGASRCDAPACSRFWRKANSPTRSAARSISATRSSS